MRPNLRGYCKRGILCLLLLAWMLASFSTAKSEAPYQIYLPVIFSPTLPLPNGSFELGTANWILFPTATQLIYSQSELPPGIIPRTGSQAAWLGYHTSADASLETSISQQIVIPANAANLSFWTQIRSEKAYGFSQSRLLISVNGQILSWIELCRDISVNSWDRQFVKLSQFSNQEVKLTIQVTLQPGDNAQVFLDDFEFISP